jgi:hypothetical protein
MHIEVIVTITNPRLPFFLARLRQVVARYVVTETMIILCGNQNVLTGFRQLFTHLPPASFVPELGDLCLEFGAVGKEGGNIL